MATTTACRPTTTCASRTGWPGSTRSPQLTGESTEEFPDDPAIDATNPIDDPDILDFVSLADGDGNPIDPSSDLAGTTTVEAERRTTVAARLKAIFGDVDQVDAFTGMVSEPHVEGTEFGELQLAMWTRQFSALRDGDRFFYGNDPALGAIASEFGIDFRASLGEVIAANTEIDAGDLVDNVFLLEASPATADDPEDVGVSDDPEAEERLQPEERRQSENRGRDHRNGRGDEPGNRRRDA